MELVKKLLLSSVKDIGITYVGGTLIAGYEDDLLSVALTSLTGGISSSPGVGDIVIVLRGLAKRGIGGCTVNDPTGGYTRIANRSQSDFYSSGINAAYKFMAAPLDTTVVFPDDGATTAGVMIRVYRNVNSVTPMDATPTTASRGDYAEPNPPSITAVTEEALLIATAVSSYAIADANERLFTCSNLDDMASAHFYCAPSGQKQAITVGSAVKEDVAGYYNPNTFEHGVGGPDLNNSSASITMVLRPR